MINWQILNICHRPFADAVRAGVGSVMCSYNQINNSYGCQNSYTLNYLLKEELDFLGFGSYLSNQILHNQILDNVMLISSSHG
jgi:hypothetical protein